MIPIRPPSPGPPGGVGVRAGLARVSVGVSVFELEHAHGLADLSPRTGRGDLIRIVHEI